MRSKYLSIGSLRRDIGAIPAEVQRNLRPAMKRAATPMLADMRRRSSWSSRIPGAITVSSNFGPRNTGVLFRVSGTRAPHARPYEGLSSRGTTFRHPVFGNREVWVAQQTRPFLFPAVNAGKRQLMLRVSEAIRKSL